MKLSIHFNPSAYLKYEVRDERWNLHAVYSERKFARAYIWNALHKQS